MKKTTQDAINDGIVNMYWKIAKPYIVLIGMILWVITGFVSAGLKNPLLFIGTYMVGLIAVITLALNSVNNVSKSELNKPEPDEYDNFYPDRDGI